MQVWVSLQISLLSAHQHFECIDQGRKKQIKPILIYTKAS